MKLHLDFYRDGTGPHRYYISPSQSWRIRLRLPFCAWDFLVRLRNPALAADEKVVLWKR